MANVKKVYFYKVNVKNKATDTTAPQNTVYNYIKTIDGFNENGKEFTYALSQDNVDHTIMEFLKVNAYSIFGRIGKKEDLNYLHIRSSENNTSHNLKIPKGSYAEKFTYFYYILDTGILAFLSILGAPNFRKFEKILNQLCSSSCVVTTIAIANQRVIDVLKGKDTISGFTINTTVPVDEFLGCDNLHISRQDFVDLENASSISINITVKGKRKRNISNKFGNDNPLFGLMDRIVASVPHVRASVKGKNKNEKMQDYDILDELFTYVVELPIIKEEKLFVNEMEKVLLDAYNNNINDILIMAR